MPNDENKIILEFPASSVSIELGTTITFDNISGFLNSDRVTVDSDTLTEKLSAMDSEIGEKANADDVYDKTYMDGIFEQIDNAFTGVNNSLNTKMDKNNPVGTGSFSLNRKSGTTVGQYSFTTGQYCEASGDRSHAEGYDTVASGGSSHAEGSLCRASGNNAHAEGSSTTASGSTSHAEGYGTKATGSLSHAEGRSTEAKGENQHVSGKYNIVDNNNTYAEIIGNGTNNNNRSNARTLDWQGNEVIAGDLTYNGNKSITSEVQRLDGRIDALPDPMVFKGTLGVGGTIQALPTASASNEGYTYKVITDGTYAGTTAKVGDVFTSDGSTWVLIPSGDTDTDTWRAIKVNGVEKLGNGISSGSVDFRGSANVDVTFDADGNKIEVATKNIYTQSEVDTLIANAVDSVLPTDSVAKSAIATFETDYAKPIELKAYIEATQASGTPTPSTPIPISGWNSVNVVRTGKNLFDQDSWFISNGYTKNDDGSYYKTTNPLNVPIWENKSGYNGRITLTFQYKYDNATQIGFYPIIRYTDGSQSIAYTTPTTEYATRTLTSTSGKIVKDIVSSYGNNIGSTIKEFQIELGTVSTSYEAYNGNALTIALGDTYYGGYVTQDKVGHRQLVITYGTRLFSAGMADGLWSASIWGGETVYSRILADVKSNNDVLKLTNSLSEIYEEVTPNYMYGHSEPCFCINNSLIRVKDTTVSSFEEWKQQAAPYKYTYPLATPIIIDLPDGEPINALIGTNNLFADSGDIECSFKCGVAMYVDNHSGGGNRSVNLAKSVEEEVKEEPKDEPVTRQER